MSADWLSNFTRPGVAGPSPLDQGRDRQYFDSLKFRLGFDETLSEMNDQKPRAPFVNPVELIIFGFFGALFFQTLQHFVKSDGWSSTQAALNPKPVAPVVAELELPCDLRNAVPLATNANSVRLVQAKSCAGRAPASGTNIQVTNSANGYSGAAFLGSNQKFGFSTDLIPLKDGSNAIELQHFSSGKWLKTEQISVQRAVEKK
jgi:hypothetical protein